MTDLDLEETETTEKTPVPQFRGAGGGGVVTGRSVSVRPSARVTETNRPPGVPSRSGRTDTFTSSPGFSVVDFHPAFTRYAGDVISTFQVTVAPFSSCTSTSIQECGLVQPNCLTVPTSVTDFVRSMPAAEWCASATPVATSNNAASEAASKVFIGRSPSTACSECAS